MRWCCFLFWFYYRLILACLAHFNWALALYTNCIYFTLWKSYDLLWFWMHLTLCSCFVALRSENYLIVWSNLIIKKWTKYPSHTYKQIYLILYGGIGTKAERELARMATVERKEEEERRSRKLRRQQSNVRSDSDSSDGEADEAAFNKKYPFPMYGGKAPVKPQPKPSIIMEEEDRECRKYIFIGEAESSTADLQRIGGQEPQEEEGDLESGVVEEAAPEEIDAPSPPPRIRRQQPEQPDQQEQSEQPEQPDAETSEPKSSPQDETTGIRGWLADKVPNAIKNKLQRSRQSSGQPANGEAANPTNNKLPKEQSEDAVSVTWSARIKGLVPKFPKSVSIEADTNEMDVLRPDYSNSHDVKDAKIRRKREKHEKRALQKRVRDRIREELEAAAQKERKRKMMSDAIELLLQLLRMMSSFAILVGNIRKTFIPAQITFVRPGARPIDDSLLMLFRATVFMDVSLFWINVLWVYCLQWHLCCRLGFLRFWFWAAILGLVAGVGMLMPMSYVQNNLDLSWCRFAEGSPLESYQPKWN